MSAARMHEWWPGMNPGMRALRIVGVVISGVVIAAVFALAFGWLVMLLWNWLMPALFHLGMVTYWQAFGIVVLAKLIFGAAGGGARHWGPRHHGAWKGGAREGHGRDDWRYYREYWEKEGKQAFERYVEEQKSTQGA